MKNSKINTTRKYNNTKRIVNWNEYNKALGQRADTTLYISRAIADKVFIKPKKTKKAGRPKEYSDAYVLLLLTLRELYRLPLRQTVCFLAGFLKIMGISWKLPDYSTLSRRMRTLYVDFCQDIRPKLDGKKIILALDSSGLKVFGEGEWKVRKHGYSYHRTWIETHIAMDYESRNILGLTSTESNVHDATQFKPLVRSVKENVPKSSIDIVIGDGAYDVNDFYQYAEDEWFYFIAPPPKNATLNIKGSRKTGISDAPGWEERNNIIARISEIGIENWKTEVGYHRRSLVENAFYRLKTIFGSNLKSRNKAAQYTEQCIRAKLINRFNVLGLPKYTLITD